MRISIILGIVLSVLIFPAVPHPINAPHAIEAPEDVQNPDINYDYEQDQNATERFSLPGRVLVAIFSAFLGVGVTLWGTTEVWGDI